MIYLDNNSTTFLDPQVYKQLLEFYATKAANPSSMHRFGQIARGILTDCQNRLASFFGCKPNELIFTSGATEAMNMLIRSCPAGSHIVTSSLEHPAVLEPLKSTDYQITYLNPLPGKGAILLDQVKAAVRSDTRMIILMAANNETGVMTDIESIAEFAAAEGISLIVDGVAQLGKEAFFLYPGISSVCFSGHKIHAPTGIGLAIVKERKKLSPLILGGPQQNKMRGGTENLSAAVAFTKAVELIDADEHCMKMSLLKKRFEEGVLSNIEEVVIHGNDSKRVSNTSNMAFLGVEGETLLMRLDQENIAASHGSACSSGIRSVSHVLLKMGIPSEIARSSIRFSLSRFTTESEIDETLETLIPLIKSLRT